MSVIPAMAAVGSVLAIVVAFETVLEARTLRREDRLHRLLELVAELGESVCRC